MTDEQKKLDALKADFISKLREAEVAAYAYFCECPVGGERIKAANVYENVRTALRRA